MSDQENQKGFKVTDRRSFTAEGERRTSESSDESERVFEQPLDDAQPKVETVRAGSGDGAQFLDVLGLLATQAALALGEPNPVTGRSEEDLHGARMFISMLEVLQSKTAGNLTSDEAKAIDETLDALRTRFVTKVKSSQG